MKMKEENYFPANCQNPFFLFWAFFRPKKVLCSGESYIESCYDVLHMSGDECVLEDIRKILNRKGAIA